MTKEFVDRDYADRQLIVVAPDDVAQATRKAEQQVTTEQEGVNWARIGEIVLRGGCLWLALWLEGFLSS